MNLGFLERPGMEGVRAHWADWPPERRMLVTLLVEDGQAHLFEAWDAPGTAEAEKNNFLGKLEYVDQSYPGGLVGYTANSRRLLAEARRGLNPFEGFVPERPDRVNLTALDAEYDRCEALGVAHFAKMGIVMVAGGLGERLGYGGIKIDMPVEVLETTPYIQHYAACIRAMEARMKERRPVPIVIMVSQDTEAPTVSTLETNGYFGLRKEQVHLLRQDMVPALSDNEGHLALGGKYELLMRPHGHGDIHMLLHTSGLAYRLEAEGIEHLVFIQDTNGQVFNAIPAALGISVEQGYDFNSLAVNRIPGEAAGGLVKLVREDRAMTLNVEYNQLDALLRATVSPEGDVPSEEGFSIFPGNINVLLIRMSAYVRILQETHGIVAEFVNPKYANAERTAFKTPARLETMMQDMPKLFGPERKVGVTVFDRRWSFSANKNSLANAAAKHAAGGPPESAATAEADFYHAGRVRLRAAGMAVSAAATELICGVPFTKGPKVVLRPSFAMTLAEIRAKISGGAVSDDATLILDGAGIRLEGVEMAGNSALVVKACEGARVVVRGRFENKGFAMERLAETEIEDETVPEYLRMRGYRFENCGAAIYEFDQPGEYVVEV